MINSNDLLQMDDDGRNYIIQYAEKYQSSIVNSRNTNTNTKGSYVWTYRSTGCDVISILTTTLPIKNGKMKDIKVHNKEMRRIKPPVHGKRFGSGVGGNPLEEQTLDAESNKRKMCHILKEEKRQFMSKLKLSRYIRTTIETSAASCIQRFYRGYSIRKNKLSFNITCQITKDMRATLRNYILDVLPDNDIILTWGEHRDNYIYKRNNMASTIQRGYRCYLSRKCLRRKRIDNLVICRRSAAIRIQQLARYKASSDRVTLLKIQRKTLRLGKAVTIIQRTTRKFLATRRVNRRRQKLRWIAARMIQCWFRSHKSKQMSVEWKQMTIIMQQYNRSRKIQCAIRMFLSKRRVNRIRYRRLWLFTFNAIACIQKIIRAFVGKARVKHIRESHSKRTKTIKDEKNNLIDNNVDDDVFTLTLDRGDTAGSIIDLFLKKTYSPSQTDDNGNTLINVAAQSGFIDLIVKCANLGFDINKRNNFGLTPFMTSMKYGHLDIAQFFVKASEGVFDSPLDQLDEDDAIKLVTDTIMAETTTENLINSLQFIFSKEIPIEADYCKLQEAAFLAACSKGNIEVYEYLVQNNISGANNKPESIQNCLLKSSESSVNMLSLLLEIDSQSIDSVDATKADLLLGNDSNGKDCLLLAALSGMTDVVSFIEKILTKASNPRPSPESVTWTSADFVAITNLITNGNEICLKYVLDCKIEYETIIPEMNNATLSIIAAKVGNTSILDLLLSKKADFSIQDADGKTVFHYMTYNGKDISQLLLHENAIACNITEYSLAVPDNNGNTPVHVAAIKGLIITVDLLAGKGMEKALQTKNKLGLTPLLIACSNINIDLVKSYINLGADVKVEDLDGHNAIWHLYHPHELIVKSGRRTIAGEYYTKKSTVAPSKAERQAEALRLGNDIDLIQLLLKEGCPLYQRNRNIDSLLELKKTSREKVLGRSSKITRSSVCDLSQFNKEGLEAGDIAVLELSLVLFKDLPALLSPDSLWNLLLSSIIFDDGTGKCFQTLIEAGADKKLVDSDSFTTLADAKPNPKHILQYTLFDGMTVLGWAIRSGNNSAVQQLIRKNLNPTLPLDVDGNNGLHYAACFGQGSTVDMILGYEDELVRIEQPNKFNLTPVMMASIGGNYHAMKRLMAYGGDLRRGLEKKYWGWLLVLARRQESNQKNLQWGRTGDDDERYFPISKDPFYKIWYKG